MLPPPVSTSYACSFHLYCSDDESPSLRYGPDGLVLCYGSLFCWEKVTFKRASPWIVQCAPWDLLSASMHQYLASVNKSYSTNRHRLWQSEVHSLVDSTCVAHCACPMWSRLIWSQSHSNQNLKTDNITSSQSHTTNKQYGKSIYILLPIISIIF